MALVTTLFARIGLFSAKPQAPDAFDARLTRIGLREHRLAQMGHVFRS